MESEPANLIENVTVRQTTYIWSKNRKSKKLEWILAGHRYSRMPTKALQEEWEEYLLTGKQQNSTDRIEKLKKIVKRQKK